MNKFIVCTMAAVGLLSVSACHDKGRFEKAGERTDEIIDNVQDGDPILHKKGPVEKAGEAIDDAVRATPER